jgi:hypothetical protein
MSFTGYAFDIYPYNDPNGTRLVRLTPAKGLQLAFRQPEQGFGMADGQIVIHSAHADATAANFHKHNLVKVVDIATETKVGGFFLEEGDFAALSAKEEGGRLLTFRGPNTTYYLERAILREQPFSEIPEAGTVRGSFDVDGMWTWTNIYAGQIMVRALEEGFYQPGPGGTSADAPLADATWDFTRSVDSNGNAWSTSLSGAFDYRWGTSVLDLLISLQRGGLWWRSGADLDYHAYDTDPAVDRTSATLASGKVRFAAGVNIVDQVSRDITASVERSAVLVLGSENTTSFVTGGSSDVTWIGAVDSSTTSDTGALSAIGNTNLDDREVVRERAFPLRHIVADDELNGGYVPFRHYEPGDLVTIHTGTNAHDFNNFAIPVSAVRILHDQAGNWFGMPELGAQALSAESKAFEERVNRIIHQPGGHSHPPNPMLCQPGVLAEATSTRLYFSTDAGAVEPSTTAGWENTSNAGGVRSLYTSPDGTYSGSASTSDSSNGAAGGEDVIKWRGVYGPLSSSEAAVLAAGGATLKGQIRARARSGIGISEASQDMISQIGIHVTTGATTTIRGTALALHTAASSTGAAKWPAQTTLVNRAFPPAGQTNTLSAVSGAAAGDYLYVEIGKRDYTTVTGGSSLAFTNDNAGDLPEDETTTAAFNSWIEFGTSGDILLSSVGDGHPDLVGSSVKAKRCDDTEHFFSDRAPTVNDDFANAGMRLGTHWVWVDDTENPTESFGSWMLVDNSEGAAIWLQISSGTSVGAHTHSASDITDLDPTSSTVVDHGTMGATEDFDFTDGTDHEGVLDENLTVTLTGATSGEAAWMTLKLTQDATGTNTLTLPASVVNGSDVETAFDTTANAVNIISIFTYDGGTTWYAFLAGGSGSPAAADVSVTDSGAYYTGTDVEAVLQEIGADLDAGVGSDTKWIVDPGAPSYSGTGPVTVALTSKFGIDSSGNPYYNAANVTDGEEAALGWDSTTETYFLRPYYPA